jgi:hypothetical protein
MSTIAVITNLISPLVDWVLVLSEIVDVDGITVVNGCWSCCCCCWHWGEEGDVYGHNALKSCQGVNPDFDADNEADDMIVNIINNSKDEIVMPTCLSLFILDTLF